MLFSGVTFLYCFLPVALAVCFLAPPAARNAVLLAASLFFYAWGEPRLAWLMAATIAVFYLCALAIGRYRAQGKLWLGISVAAGLGLLGIFKYGDFFVGTLNCLGLRLKLPGLALPIGISFYTFQCISYVADVYRGDAPPQRSLIAFGCYVALFPQLIAGPIVRYTQVAQALERREHTWENLALGLRRFLLGLGKKVLLANQFGELTALCRSRGDGSVLLCWLYALGFTLQIYYDFSGYSDMAIGLGRIFGFRFPENFNYPYLSSSVTEFWRRWHMTLGGWFRDYVYIPLGGSRVSRGRWLLNILAVWGLTGLWHGASWNFVVWGLFYGVLLLLEKRFPRLARLPRPLAHCYVMAAVVAGFVIFGADGLGQAARDLGGMLALRGLPAVTAQSLYQLRSFGVLFLAGALGATPVPRRLGSALVQRYPWVQGAALPVLLVLSTAYLVDGSFNPFLYFRF